MLLHWYLTIYLVDLQVVDNETVEATTDTAQVGLHCDMSLYIHPDEDLQWLHNGQLLTSGTDRHTISYRNSHGVGQFGGQETGASRESTLVISQPQISDSGHYTCAISGTNVSQDIQLSITGEFLASLYISSITLSGFVFQNLLLQPLQPLQPL